MPRKPDIPAEVRAQAAIAIRTRTGGKKAVSTYESFRKKYYHDPVGFARDCVHWGDGEGLTLYQQEIYSSLTKHHRACIRSPHGAGKTMLASILILWFALTRDGEDWKIPTTASAWRQLTKFLWPEVHKWSRRLRWDVIGRPEFDTRIELQEMSLKLRTGEGFALASDEPANIEGAHADHLLYIFDEAKTIVAETWDAVEGAFSTTGECLWLAISTPGEPAGRFYDIQRRGAGLSDWYTRHITLEEAIAEGRISRDWADKRRQQWGEKSAVYQNRVAGEFAASEEDSVVALSWVEAANERWLTRQEENAFGPLTRLAADIGRGGDPSIIGRRHGMAVKSFEEMNERDVMAVTGRIAGIMQGSNVQAVIDVIGIGAGVVDRLRELKEISGRVLPFNASEKTELRDISRELGFVNQRASAWWTVREGLQDGTIDLPPDDTLTGELTAPTWRVMSGGKIQIESKEDVRNRIGRSTNRADAVVMLFWKRSGGASLEEIERWSTGEVPEENMPDDIAVYMEWPNSPAPRKYAHLEEIVNE